MSKLPMNWNHLVSESPWPLMMSLGLMELAMGTMLWLQSYEKGESVAMMGMMMMMMTLGLWWSDVMMEGTYMGEHTKGVVEGMSLGMMLFMMSEVVMFVGMFWGNLHSALAPSMEMGSQWPGTGMEVMDYLEVPLLNTVLLLSSGALVTWTHHNMMSGKSGTTGMKWVMMMGMMFMSLQWLEYKNSAMTMSDGMYGSTFYVLTGLHGFHMMMGTMYLWMQESSKMTKHHHVGLETGMWYWHFVDVVWLMLFMMMYYWGGSEMKNNSSEATSMLFQDPGSPMLKEMMSLHDKMMYYLMMMTVMVLWMMMVGMMMDKEKMSKKYETHGTAMEMMWTVMRGMMLMMMALPSFKLLYLMDEMGSSEMTVKVMGKQWYWVYEYSDYEEDKSMESYMMPTEELSMGQLSLLEVDNSLVLPMSKNMSLMVTAGDVMHSFAVPSLGMKMDAMPGSLNGVGTMMEKEGVYYGNCSELCGVNHYGMPMVMEAVNEEKYMESMSAM